MASDGKNQNSELFIVDNSDSQRKVLDYLHEWTQIPQNSLDIATGYFEIGSLLRLDGQWQKLDKIRILMGDEVTRRTKDALLAGLANITGALEASIVVTEGQRPSAHQAAKPRKKDGFESQFGSTKPVILPRACLTHFYFSPDEQFEKLAIDYEPETGTTARHQQLFFATQLPG